MILWCCCFPRVSCVKTFNQVKKKDVRSRHGFSDVLSGLQASSGWSLTFKGWIYVSQAFCVPKLHENPTLKSWQSSWGRHSHRGETSHVCLWSHQKSDQPSTISDHGWCVQGKDQAALPCSRQGPSPLPAVGCPCRIWGLYIKTHEFPQMLTSAPTGPPKAAVVHRVPRSDSAEPDTWQVIVNPSSSCFVRLNNNSFLWVLFTAWPAHARVIHVWKGE